MPETIPAPSPRDAAERLADWGFLVKPDLPDRPGPAWLMVAMRERPTLRHYDPELVEYWTSRGGRGTSTQLTHATRMPLEVDFSWGLIRIVDRLEVSNEYLTFGGHVSGASIDGTTYAVFSSAAPLLRRGGHSQGWDQGAQDLGAFFGRLIIAVDYASGFEARMAAADPLARYAAFIDDVSSRYRTSPTLRSLYPDWWRLVETEERNLRRDNPDAWTAGTELRVAAQSR